MKVKGVRTMGVVVLAVALFGGCAATRPTVLMMPAGGVSMAEFQADEVACQPYAEQASKAAFQQEGWNSFGRQLTAGMFGAALGASVGGRYGMAGYGAEVGAMAGMNRTAVYGYNSQQAASQQAYDLAYAQCMRTKGHKLPGFQSIDDQPPRMANGVSNSTGGASGPMQCAAEELRPVCKTYRVRTDLYRTHCEDRSMVDTAISSNSGFKGTVKRPDEQAPPGTYQAERCELIPAA
jgi:hypothetical protein